MNQNYNYNYEGDYSKVITIEDNKKRTFINALSITNTILHASLELGVSEKCIKDFMGTEEITIDHVKVMRKRFLLSGKKVKLQFKAYKNGEKTSYRRNSEIKN